MGTVRRVAERRGPAAGLPSRWRTRASSAFVVSLLLMTLAIAQARVEWLEVAPLAVPCAPDDEAVSCLMVRPSDGAPWRVSAEAIEGFDARPGHGYRLLLEVAPDGGRSLLAVLQQVPLGDVRWRIDTVEYAGETFESGALGDAWLRVDVSGDRVQGSSGCNAFFGAAYAFAPGRLAIEPLAATRMACPEPSMVAERALLAVLEGVDAYHEAGGSLRLGGPAGAVWLRPELPSEATASLRRWGDQSLARFDESAAAALSSGAAWPLDPLQVALAAAPAWDAARIDVARRDAEPEAARYTVVRIEAGGYLDDSLAGARRVVVLERQVDGRWRVIAESDALRCARGEALWIAASELCP
jgi:heat shock protein HslJ